MSTFPFLNNLWASSLLFSFSSQGEISLLMVLGIVVVLFISVVTWTFRNGISPMPTSWRVQQKLFAYLEGIEKFPGKIYELGSGWGTVAFSLAKTFPENEILAYETSPLPFLFSRLWFKKVLNLKFIRQDFFQVSLDSASLVFCYLYPKAMEKLKLKFERELKPGTLVISNTFAIPEWHPEVVLTVNDLYKTKIYVYLFKHKIDKILKKKLC